MNATDSLIFLFFSLVSCMFGPFLCNFMRFYREAHTVIVIRYACPLFIPLPYPKVSKLTHAWRILAKMN